MMKLYDITEKPLKIYGLAVADSEKSIFSGCPKRHWSASHSTATSEEELSAAESAFRRMQRNYIVKMTLAGTKEDINIPLSGSAGADIYLGKGTEAAYLGYIAPKIHTEGEITVEKTFDLTGEEYS